MIEIFTILIFSALQSIFGIGILFFGTPTLILLGFSFAETLSVVLPASIAVSLLQIISGELPQKAWRNQFWIWCLSPMVLLLVMVLWRNWTVELELVIALTLLSYVLIRISPAFHRNFRELLKKHPQSCLAVIGAVHGLSNLGGGLLAIFAANSFNDKLIVRSHIAFCYLCFALIQLTTLAVLIPDVMQWMQLVYAAIAAGVFLALENRVFSRISMPVFDKVFTILIGGYSTLILLKFFGALTVPATT